MMASVPPRASQAYNPPDAIFPPNHRRSSAASSSFAGLDYQNQHEKLYGTKWEKKFPGLSFLCYLVYLALFCFAALSNMEVAFTSHLRMGLIKSFETANFQVEKPTDQKFYKDIEKIREVYKWLKVVVVPLTNYGTLANYVECVMWSLTVQRGEAETNPSEAFKGYVPNLRRDDVASEERRFRCGENATSSLEELETQGWFQDALTTWIDFYLEFYNGVTQSFGTLSYHFDLSSTGNVLKERSFLSSTIRNYFVPLLFALLFTVVTIVYAIVEVRAYLKAKGLLHNLQNVSRSKACMLYRKWRSAMLISVLLGLLYGILLIAEWILLVVIVNIPTIENIKAEETTAIYPSLRFVSTVVCCLAFISMVWRSLLYLYEMHQDFRIPMRGVGLMFGAFFGIFITLFLLWMGWACANYIRLGPFITDFSNLGMAIFHTFQMWFGAPYLRQMEPESAVLYSFLMITFWFIIVPMFTATVVNVYLQSEGDRVQEETGLWVYNKALKMTENFCFCFAGSPDGDDDYTAKIQAMHDKEEQEKIEHDNQRLTDFEARQVVVSVADDRKLNARRIVVSVFVVFCIFFYVSVTLMSGVFLRGSLRSSLIAQIVNQPFVTTSPFTTIPKTLSLARIASECRATQGPAHPLLAPPVIVPRSATLLQIASLDGIYDWLTSVVVEQIMNPLYDSSRHTLLLSNPPVVLKLQRVRLFCNKNPAGADFYPNIRTASTDPSVTDVSLDSFNGFYKDDSDMFIQFIYQNNNLTDMKQQVADLRSQGFLDFQMSSLTVNWAEYNVDADVYSLNEVKFDFHPSGEMLISPFAYVFSGAWVNNDRYRNAGFVLLIVTSLLLGAFLAVLLLQISRGLIKANMWLFLDLLLFLSYLLMIFIYSCNLNSQIYPNWIPTDGFPDSNHPAPSIVPGPVLPWPYIPGSAVGESPPPSAPNVNRALRLMEEMQLSSVTRDWLIISVAVTLVFVTLRLLMCVMVFPKLLMRIPEILQKMRWKFMFLSFVVLCLFLSCWFLGYLSLGSYHASFSSPALSFISCLMMITPAWNLGVVEFDTSDTLSFMRLTYIYCCVFVIFFFILNNLLLAIFYSGFQTSRIQNFDSVVQEFRNEYHVNERKRLTFWVNSDVILHWKAFYKALCLKNDPENPDYVFANRKDLFFEGFQNLPVLRTMPTEPRLIVRRALLATNLVRIQQYLTDDLFLEAKMHLMSKELDAIVEYTKSIHKVSKQKEAYMDSLEQQVAGINEEMEKINDRIAVTTMMDTVVHDPLLDLHLNPQAVGTGSAYASERELEKSYREHQDRRERIQDWRRKVDAGEVDVDEQKKKKKEAKERRADRQKEKQLLGSGATTPPLGGGVVGLLVTDEMGEREKRDISKFSNERLGVSSYKMTGSPNRLIEDDEDEFGRPLHRRGVNQDEESGHSEDEWDAIRQRFGGIRHASIVYEDQKKGQMVIVRAPEGRIDKSEDLLTVKIPTPQKKRIGGEEIDKAERKKRTEVKKTEPENEEEETESEEDDINKGKMQKGNMSPQSLGLPSVASTRRSHQQPEVPEKKQTSKAKTKNKKKQKKEKKKDEGETDERRKREAKEGLGGVFGANILDNA